MAEWSILEWLLLQFAVLAALGTLGFGIAFQMSKSRIRRLQKEFKKLAVNISEAIANAATKYYPEVSLTSEEKINAAFGLRPVSPDGLPYIGKSSKCHNLTIAAGHAMMGWSMATATGLLVSEIISNKKPSLDTTMYHPDRIF